MARLKRRGTVDEFKLKLGSANFQGKLNVSIAYQEDGDTVGPFYDDSTPDDRAAIMTQLSSVLLSGLYNVTVRGLDSDTNPQQLFTPTIRWINQMIR